VDIFKDNWLNLYDYQPSVYYWLLSVRMIVVFN